MANADPAHVSCAVGDADDKRFRVDGGVRPRERRDASVVAELERQQDAIASHLWFICGLSVVLGCPTGATGGGAGTLTR